MLDAKTVKGMNIKAVVDDAEGKLFVRLSLAIGKIIMFRM